MLRGVRPFLSLKYDITRQPRYEYLSDFDKDNAFDAEKHLTQLRKPRSPVAPDEPFDFYDFEDEAHNSDATEDINAEPTM